MGPCELRPSIARLQRAATIAVVDVAARALEDRAQRVGGTPQSSGERVGIVDGHEHRVDLVHERQQPLGLGALLAPEAVEHLAAQLAGRFRHPVEVRLHVDAELRGGGHGLSSTNASVRLASANSFLASLRNPA